MKNILYIILLSTLAISSCTKVIDVDLNEVNTNVVIEGNYTAEDSTVRVQISLTSNYFSAEPSPDINSATVTIVDELGNPTSIPSIGNGQYELANYIPVFNSNYGLNVVYNSVSYTANCKMNTPVQLEDITSAYFPSFFGSEPGYATFMNFYDPAGVENFYAAILTVNGVEYAGIDEMFTQDDQLTDGNLVERPLFTNELFDIDDTIGMELRSIDPVIYDYINQTSSIAGGGNSTAPGNPISNWDNDALGYFNCYSSSRKEIIIQ